MYKVSDLKYDEKDQHTYCLKWTRASLFRKHVSLGPGEKGRAPRKEKKIFLIPSLPTASLAF